MWIQDLLANFISYNNRKSKNYITCLAILSAVLILTFHKLPEYLDVETLITVIIIILCWMVELFLIPTHMALIKFCSRIN
jgi:predicted nucleic-acid-binding protein